MYISKVENDLRALIKLALALEEVRGRKRPDVGV